MIESLVKSEIMKIVNDLIVIGNSMNIVPSNWPNVVIIIMRITNKYLLNY